MSAFHEDIFIKTLESYELDKMKDKLLDNGVDCLKTFCTLEESDFKGFGLNVGQIKKCLAAAVRMKEKGLSTDELDTAEQAEETTS